LTARSRVDVSEAIVRHESAAQQLASVYDGLRDPLRLATPYARASMHLLRSEGEAVIVGPAVALLKHKVLGGSLEYKGWQVDGVLAALAAAASLALATNDDGLAVDARNVASDLTAICSFRMMDEYMAAKKTQAPSAHGETDSLLQAAAELGT